MDWFRLYHEFASDPKVQMMNEAMQRRLIMVFCLQCSNGLETFHETDRETSIAFALRISAEEVAITKAEFLRRGFINEDWTLRNWSKRQYASDSSTSRVQKHREAKKQLETFHEADEKRSSNALEQSRTDTEQNRTEKQSRGSRLPADWQPTPDELRWAMDARPDLDVSLEVERFRDHWIAKSGKDGVKNSWTATWRNWIRGAFPPRNGQVRKSTVENGESPAAMRKL